MKIKKNPNAVALGKKGGAARAKKLTPEQRQEIARKGAEARWGSSILLKPQTADL